MNRNATEYQLDLQPILELSLSSKFDRSPLTELNFSKLQGSIRCNRCGSWMGPCSCQKYDLQCLAMTVGKLALSFEDFSE